MPKGEVFLKIDDVNIMGNSSVNEDIQKHRLITRVRRNIFHHFYNLSHPKGGVVTILLFHLV